MESDGLVVLEKRLRTALADSWGAMPLTSIPDRLKGCDWQSYGKKLIYVLRLLPHTLRLVQGPSKGEYYAVLTEPLLLTALKRKLLAEGLSKQGESDLEWIAWLTGRKNAEQLIRDTGVEEETYEQGSSTAHHQQAKQPVAATRAASLAAIEASLRQAATANLAGVRLSTLPEFIPADWRQHFHDIKALVLRFPDTVSVVNRSQETEPWVMLARRLLLDVVRNNLKPLLGAAPAKALSLDAVLAAHSVANLNLLAAGAKYGSVEDFLIGMGFGVIRGKSKAETTVHLDERSVALQVSAVPSVAAKPTNSSVVALHAAAVPSVAAQKPLAASGPSSHTKNTDVAAAELIDSVDRCRVVMDLLAKDQPLALDCEGSLWGRRIDVCLLQIATKSGRCFLFDITQGGAALFIEGGLRRLLEDVHVLKVGHDLRSDASALYCQFNVLLNHVFDTQVGHAFLEPASRQAGLNHVLDKYAAGQQNELKRFMKAAWDDDKDYWRRRPLTKEGLDYAANDVRFLLQAFDVMAHELEQQGLFDQALSMSRTRVDHARSTPESTPQRALTAGAAAIAEEEITEDIATDCFVSEADEDLEVIFDALPDHIADFLREDERLWGLTEIVFDLGRSVLVRFSGQGLPRLASIPGGHVTADDLEKLCSSITNFDSENRAGISRTLHRISRLQNRRGDVVGLTIRVGKTIRGLVTMIADVLKDAASRKTSILLLGAPGMGKTSVIREMASVLSDDELSVMIVDTSNEIAGDGDVPHPAIGSARRMQVPEAREQHRRMIEAVQNHTPDIIIVDEIGTRDEASACCTIARRGVMLIATAHGVTLKDVVDNPSLNAVVGGIETVILSDRAMYDRQLAQKTVREAKGPSAFGVAIELKSRTEWIIHHNVRESVNLMLSDKLVPVEVRERTENGRVVATRKHIKATSGLEEQQALGQPI